MEDKETFNITTIVNVSYALNVIYCYTNILYNIDIKTIKKHQYFEPADCYQYILNCLFCKFVIFLITVSQSPKTRRKKLNARMKSFSLDAPEPSKHLLAIDETTKKKSSSFTNTCLRGEHLIIHFIIHIFA